MALATGCGKERFPLKNRRLAPCRSQTLNSHQSIYNLTGKGDSALARDNLNAANERLADSRCKGNVQFAVHTDDKLFYDRSVRSAGFFQHIEFR